MNTLPAMIDVGGVAVRVVADSEAHRRCAAGRLGSVASDAAEPEIELALHIDPPALPSRPPDQRLEGVDFWSDGSDVWLSLGRAVVRVGSGLIDIGGPIDGIVALDDLDDLLQFGVSIAVAGPDRMMIHAAVLARGDDALAVVGGSGGGKSTLAAAALAGRWKLLGDDLAVVRPAAGTVQAVQRPPMVPAEMADRLGFAGETEEGNRGRIRLPAEVLDGRAHRLCGVISVDHGEEGSIELVEGADLGSLDVASAVPLFRDVIRRQLAPAAALVALPTMRLLHARDLEVRAQRAQALLEEAHEMCLASGQ